MSTDAKKGLQTEVVAVKTRWTDQLKIVKAPAGSPTAPLPLAVARTIERPDGPASAYDVEEITVKLWIDALEAGEDGAAPVRVETIAKVPDVLQQLMSSHIEERWRGELKARGVGNGWLLEKMLSWVEGAYVELLRLEPSLVEVYDGVNDSGMTIRRFAIAEPPPPPPTPPEKGSDEESSEEELVEAMPQLNLEEERAQRIREKAEAEADRLWREQRRAEAEANPDDYPSQQKVGKKEQARLAEDKKKHAHARLAKEGSKAHKASATRDKDDEKKMKNKKNGLMH
jgi:hypothetical protein